MSEALFSCLADRKYRLNRLHSFIQHKQVAADSYLPGCSAKLFPWVALLRLRTILGGDPVGTPGSPEAARLGGHTARQGPSQH